MPAAPGAQTPDRIPLLWMDEPSEGDHPGHRGAASPPLTIYDRRSLSEAKPWWPTDGNAWDLWQPWPVSPPAWPPSVPPWARLVWYGRSDGDWDLDAAWATLEALEVEAPPLLRRRPPALPWLWLDLESVGEALCALAVARFGWLQVAHVKRRQLGALAAMARDAGRPLWRADRLGQTAWRALDLPPYQRADALTPP